MIRQFLILAVLLVTGGCAGGSLAGSGLAEGAQAYSTIAPASAAQDRASKDYKIGISDTLTVSVFQEAELSTPANNPLVVNANGNIEMPLIGTVAAAGKTASEVASIIANRLGTKYLVHPQVNVSVASSVSQKVTVQGEVTQPGVYEIKGNATLLEAIAMAKGETKLATLRQVAVFRTINGQRMGAVFDLERIRRGGLPDPELLGNDTVIVGHSGAKGVWQSILQALPVFSVFKPF